MAASGDHLLAACLRLVRLVARRLEITVSAAVSARWSTEILGGHMALTATVTTTVQCAEQSRLRRQLAQTIRALVRAQRRRLEARETANPRLASIESDLETAGEEWKRVRRLYLQHSELHGCGTCVLVDDEFES